MFRDIGIPDLSSPPKFQAPQGHRTDKLFTCRYLALGMTGQNVQGQIYYLKENKMPSNGDGVINPDGKTFNR